MIRKLLNRIARCATLVPQRRWCVALVPLLTVLGPVSSAGVWLSACVTPPQVTTSQVLPERELELIAAVKRGKDYAQGGRPELAEEQFRRALKLNPKLSSVYNDLGYVLQAQDRRDEARMAYLQAITLQPSNLIARENYARILFSQGDVETSISELQRVLDTYYSLPPEKLKQAVGTDYGPAELQNVYRALASSYYNNGQYDEAICYSEKTLSGPNRDFSQIGQHARLLLSLGQTEKARVMLRDFVTVWQQQTPGRLLIDYGIALYSSQDFNLAAEAMNRALSAKDVDQADRRDAKLLALLSGLRSDPTKPNERVEAFLADDPEFCAHTHVDPYGYWPLSVVREVNTFMGKLCRDEKQLVVSG